MQKQVIRDRNGKTIGTIEQQDDGKLVAYTPGGKKLGVYYPEEDVTRKPSGGDIGDGNLLAALFSGSLGV